MAESCIRLICASGVVRFVDEGHSRHAAAAHFQGVGFLRCLPGEGLLCAGVRLTKSPSRRAMPCQAGTASGVSFGEGRR